MISELECPIRDFLSRGMNMATTDTESDTAIENPAELGPELHMAIAVENLIRDKLDAAEARYEQRQLDWQGQYESSLKTTRRYWNMGWAGVIAFIIMNLVVITLCLVTLINQPYAG